MCDWKPGPRCFTHYAPHFAKAQDEYNAALLLAMYETANGGEVSAATRRLLDEKFLAYMHAQKEFYTSPKARDQFLERAIQQRIDMLSGEMTVENKELQEIIMDHQRRNLDMLEKQAVDGAHRWDQAKLASKIANDRNENALERGIFSEAAYSAEEIAQVDIRQWDRACPDGELILDGFEDKLQLSDATGIHRELTITRHVRIETPTGERVHLDIEARIMQKTKGSSSYTVEYLIKQDGETLGILIPNSAVQDAYYNVGAVYEARPAVREPWQDLHKGIRLRKNDWDHFARANELTDEELAEIKSNHARTHQILTSSAEAGDTAMFSRHNAFNSKVNRTHRGHRHNSTTEQFVTEQGARTSFNSVSGAKENVAQTLGSLDSMLLDVAVKARRQGIRTYAAEQFGAMDKSARDRVEAESREIMANEPERLQPKSRSEKRNRGGGRDRVERNLAREQRRANQFADSPVVAARRKEAVERGNSAMAKMQQTQGGLVYSARVEPERKPVDPSDFHAGHFYRVSVTQAGGSKKWVSVPFTQEGKLAGGLKAYKHPAKPGMVVIRKGQKAVVVVSAEQFDAMADVRR